MPTWLFENFARAGSTGALWIQWMAILTGALVAAYAVFGARDLYRRADRHLAAWVGGWFVVAAALRLAAPQGQADLYFRLEPAMYPMQQAFSKYGLTGPAWVRLLFELGGDVHTVYAIQILVGAATVIPLAVLARRLGFGATQTIAAAAILAMHPVHIRFSATDWPGIPETAFSLWGLALLLDERDHAHWGAGILLGFAACLRPEAGIVIPIAATLALVMKVPWLAVGRAVAAGAVVYSGQALATLGMAGHYPEAVPATATLDPSVHHLLGLLPTWTPLPVIIGVFACVLVGPPHARVRAWLVGWWVVTSAMLLSYGYGHVLLAGARHQVRMVPFLALAAAVPIGVALDRVGNPRRRLEVGLLGVLFALPTLPQAYWATSLHHELDFAEQVLPTLPERCQGFAFSAPGRDLALRPPRYLAPQLQWQLHDPSRGQVVLPEDGCLYYYRGANCFAAYHDEPLPEPDSEGRLPLREDCARFEAAHDLIRFRGRRIDAVRFSTDRYPPNSTLEVGVFIVDGRDASYRPVEFVPGTPDPFDHAAEIDAILGDLPTAEPLHLDVEDAAQQAADAVGCDSLAEQVCDETACLVVLSAASCDRAAYAKALGDALGGNIVDLSFSRTTPEGELIVVAPIPEDRATDADLLVRLGRQAEVELERRGDR